MSIAVIASILEKSADRELKRAIADLANFRRNKEGLKRSFLEFFVHISTDDRLEIHREVPSPAPHPTQGDLPTPLFHEL